MNETLKSVILELADEFRVLPGHGPESTMAIERVNNPYLRRIAQGLSAV
jgi:glyoxylase-like metal-dependent hydrolase (beta-lactamase superfamily II)